MPWTKLKNIILVILLITNLCLLALVASPTLQSRRLLDQAREEAIRFLQGRGVQVGEDVIPQAMDLLPQTAERDLEEEERAAAALLGGPVSAEARGGEVYRYCNEAGAVQFHSDGTFSAMFSAGAFPAEEDRVRACEMLLERMEFQCRLVEEGERKFTFCQLWEGIPIFNHQVTVTFDSQGQADGLSGGRRLIGRPSSDPLRSNITVATALIDFLNGVSALGDVCNRIDAIEPGYITVVSLSGPVCLTPVWRVTTDTGAYQLDTVTGGVIRVS